MGYQSTGASAAVSAMNKETFCGTEPLLALKEMTPEPALALMAGPPCQRCRFRYQPIGATAVVSATNLETHCGDEAL